MVIAVQAAHTFQQPGYLRYDYSGSQGLCVLSFPSIYSAAKFRVPLVSKHPSFQSQLLILLNIQIEASCALSRNLCAPLSRMRFTQMSRTDSEKNRCVHSQCSCVQQVPAVRTPHLSNSALHRCLSDHEYKPFGMGIT